MKDSLKNKSYLRNAFEAVFTPYRQHGSLLLAELKKPEADIDEQKCLSLIHQGINLEYKNWPVMHGRIQGDSDIERLTVAISGETDRTPSDPATFILACGKGKSRVVEALLEQKIIHPAQWDRATGETGKIAAAKTGHLEVIKLLDQILDKLSFAPASPARSLFSSMTDYKGRGAYDYAKENGHLKVIEYMLDKGFEESMRNSDYRPADPGYDEQVKLHRDNVEKEKKESLQLRAKKQKDPSSKPIT